MHTPNFFDLPRKLALLLALVFLIASCGKEQIDEASLSQANAIDHKALVEHHKTLQDYPAEITIDNWEEFIYAPQSVIDHFAKKEMEQQALHAKIYTAPRDTPTNRMAWIQGSVIAWNGAWNNIGGVEVNLGGSHTYPCYNISFYWPGPQNYYLSASCPGALCMEYNTSSSNGLSALDVLLLNRHRLFIQCFTEARQYLAADVDRNGTITSADATIIQQVILGQLNSFPNSNNVLFIPEADYNDLDGTINGCTIENLFLSSLGTLGPCLPSSSKDRRAIKTGDVNSTWSF